MSVTLDALRPSGRFLLNATYAGPWALSIPGSTGLARLTHAAPNAMVVPFHWAERGEFAVVAGPARTVVGPGELVACLGGAPHVITKGQTTPRSLESVLNRDGSEPPLTLGPDSTKLLSGVFLLRDPDLNPMLGSLPPLLHVRLLDGPFEPIGRILRRELPPGESGSNFMIDRSLEMLWATLIRNQMTETPDDAVGFFRGLKDPRLCRALWHVHRNPAAPWTVDEMAKRASLSRSRFSARFNELVGEGPMAYVTRWRMSVAVRLLRAGDRSIAHIATMVGYESVPAFTRVFKRMLGVPPARFRDDRTPV